MIVNTFPRLFHIPFISTFYTKIPGHCNRVGECCIMLYIYYI